MQLLALLIPADLTNREKGKRMENLVALSHKLVFVFVGTTAWQPWFITALG